MFNFNPCRPVLKTEPPKFDGYLVIGETLSFYGKISSRRIEDLKDWNLEAVKTVEVVKARFTENALKMLKNLEERLPNQDTWQIIKLPSENRPDNKRKRKEPECPPPPRKTHAVWQPTDFDRRRLF